MPEKIKLVLLSFACCNPKFASSDKQYLERIKEAGVKTGLEFQIDIVHATEVMMAPDHFPWMRDALPLFMKYGSAIAAKRSVSLSATVELRSNGGSSRKA